MQQFIIVLGNPIDGVVFFGPFPSKHAAEAWAEMQEWWAEWWVAPLERPVAMLATTVELSNTQPR